jgi:acyl-CoA thioester hydrolase
VEARGRFSKPSRYGDKVRVRVRIDALTDKAVTFSCLFELAEGEAFLGEASLTYVAIGPDWKATGLPEHVRYRLEAARRRDA